MSSTSSVPKIQFTPAGLVLPQEADILDGVISDLDAAFGGGLNFALETPQGQLASSESAIIADKNDEFATFVNQVDPQYASGRFQDAIARIYFLMRKPAVPTSVEGVTLIGLAGTLVPAGTLAQDTNGNTYALAGDVTISVTGSSAGEFQNVEPGPIPCPAGTLTQVYQAVPGWDALTNPSDGVMGSFLESRADFEYRRKNSVALNARGTPESIYANVFDVDDVVDVYVKDNPTGSTVNTGSTNYPIAAHSVYVAVVGGVDLEIATAIWQKKDLGCDYNGNTSVVVTDPSGYAYPQPTYTVKFNRPSSLPVKFDVQLVNSSALPADIVARVKAAIIARFNGADGTTRERIGALILASRYYGAVSGVAQNVSIISIQIGTVTANAQQITAGIDQAPTISAANIAVSLV